MTIRAKDKICSFFFNRTACNSVIVNGFAISTGTSHLLDIREQANLTLSVQIFLLILIFGQFEAVASVRIPASANYFARQTQPDLLRFVFKVISSKVSLHSFLTGSFIMNASSFCSCFLFSTIFTIICLSPSYSSSVCFLISLNFLSDNWSS